MNSQLDEINHILSNVEPKPGLDWTKEFSMTLEEADQIANPDFIIPDLIIQGHVVAVVAEPNGGKTTIMLHMAGEMSGNGYRVFYVNADVGGGDAKEMVRLANEKGFELLLPDMKLGLSMEDVIDNLIKMNSEGGDFSKIVFIFDTLKKMTDVINKSRAKELYSLFRGLSGKGMTIVLLAHTNKYKDADGNPVYEGTGDLRSDIDELIYLIPQKHADGSMKVSTKPDKVRGKLEKITFSISPDRRVVREREFIDVAAQNRFFEQYHEDRHVIDAINRAIQSGLHKQIEIRQFCTKEKIGDRTIRNVLKRYTDPSAYRQEWNATHGLNNHYHYERV